MMKRAFSFALAAVLTASLLTACGTDTPQDNPPEPVQSAGEPTDEITQNPDPIVEPEPEKNWKIPMADLEQYVIVYAENAPQSVIDAANSLASSIETKFGYKLRVKSDYYSEFVSSAQISDYEILVGQTNRPESAEFLKSIGYKDRGYAVIGSKIVIAAHDAFVSSQTVSDFNRTVVLRANRENEFFFTTEQNSVSRGTYSYSDLTVDGISLSEYRIVYPKTANGLEQLLATKLMKSIANACGAVLDIADDSLPADGTREILIGLTNRNAAPDALSGVQDGRGYLALQNGNILLCGNSALGNATAVQRFEALYQNANASGTLALNLPDGLQSTDREGGTVNAMTFNINSDSITAERVKRVVETILQYLPDTVGIQECSKQWRGYLEAELGDYYAFVGVGANANDAGDACIILYAKEKFDLKDSGTRWLSDTPEVPSKPASASANRVYTWVELERRTDGLRFLHVNTQLESAGELLRGSEAQMLLDFMASKKELAVILTGDLGGALQSEAYSLLISDRMENAAEIAGKKSLGSFSGGLPTDVILVSDWHIDVLNYEIADSRVNGDYASDHRAGYAEYRIDYNGTETAKPSGSSSTDPKGTLEILEEDTEGKDYSPIVFFPFGTH